MSDGYKEYDPNDYLGGVQATAETPTGYKEYDPNAYLTQVTQSEKPPTFLESLKRKASNVLKGAEYFAKGGMSTRQAINPQAAEKFVKPLTEMSVEDWKKNSVLAPAIEYTAASMNVPGFTQQDKIEAEKKLVDKGKKLYEGASKFLSNPLESTASAVKAIAENPYGTAGEVVKSTIYDPEQIGIGAAGSKIIGKVLETPVAKVKAGVEDLKAQFAEKKAALMEGRPLSKTIPVEPKGFADQGFTPTQETTGIPKTYNEFVEQARKDGLDVTSPEAIEAMQRIWSEHSKGGVGGNQLPVKSSVEVSQPTNISLEPPKAPQVEAPVQPKPVEVKPLAENPEMPAERLNVDEIARKEQILNDIGVETHRKSALEGDYQGASSQYITSKADNGEYAQGMANQIRHEKEALTGHLEKIENNLGGTIPREGMFYKTDEIKRGKSVKNALEEAQEAHKTETTRLYDEASKEIGAVPVELTTLKEYLDKDSNFVHSAEKSVKTGVRDYLKEQGLLDESGAIKPMTVGQSEQLRKFINKQYNYETKGKVGDLVNRIDEDVFKNVEGKTYEDARAHFKAGKEIYDNPKAIKDLMNDEGTNQKIKDEQVMTKISSLDESQFSNLMDTLTKTGKTEAIKEIQTNLVNRVKQAGKSEINEPWNGRAAAKEFQNLGEKLQVAFKNNPEVLAELSKNIEAGHILHIPSRYPGAAVQTNLLKNKFSEMALQKAGAMVGGAGGSIAGPLGAAGGAAAGEYLGAKGANKLKSNRQVEQLQKEIKSGPLGETGEKYKIKD